MLILYICTYTFTPHNNNMCNTNFTKKYNKLTSMHDELPNNLYIYYRTSNYTEMKRYLNHQHTSEYLQIVLCMYNTNHMYYSPE